MARKNKCCPFRRPPGSSSSAAPETLSPLDPTGVSEVTWFGAEESVAEALVRAFLVVMGDKWGNGCPQGLFSEQDQAVETGFLDGPHESFGIGVQIRGLWR
jgi:hypothetical protein